jgi:3-hydroxyisobutyrate dehydrogenase-like beta-hydroxyacid dehydrogenase
MKIGFIGIGKMGGGMARRVSEAGYDLTVNDVSKEKARNLLKKGAKWTDTPEGIAASCQIVLSCLPGPPEVEAVVYGPAGLLAGWKKGDLYVDMSTNSSILIRRVAETAKLKGVTVLDAPVSGGVIGAEAGTLTIMVGGEAQSLEKVRKILEAMGNKIFHCGEVGFGNVAKVVNNMIGATCNAINAECFVLGVKAGMDPKKLFDITRVSSGNSRSLEQDLPKVLEGDFEPGFRLVLSLKDIGLALAMGKEYGVPMPVGSAVKQRFMEAKARGLGEKASRSIFLLSEEETGVKVRSR